MKSFLILSCAIFVGFFSNLRAETPADAGKLVAEIRAQQALLQQNQEKMDARLAAIAEQLRQARIFVSRGGSAKKP